jgi:hypothetical protein
VCTQQTSHLANIVALLGQIGEFQVYPPLAILWHPLQRVDGKLPGLLGAQALLLLVLPAEALVRDLGLVGLGNIYPEE